MIGVAGPTDQVLHLLLQPRHGLPGAHRKHKGVHVLVVQGHFDLLQTDRELVW